MKSKNLSKEEILKKINQVNWGLSFELIPGITTPGKRPSNPKKFFELLQISKDLTGLRVLDIGTNDGANAFELERRGAKTCAMDIHDPNVTGFNTAKEILRSNVEYKRGTVYNLKKMYDADFDIVLFKGVWYHLQHPIKAFEAISDVLKPNGMAIIAGEVLISWAETLDGKTVDPAIIEQIAKLDVPLTLCYPGHTSKPGTTCWFVPNVACVKSWLYATGFDLEKFRIFHDAEAKEKALQRFAGIARKTNREKIIEHSIKARTESEENTIISFE